MRRVVLATANPNKARELAELLGGTFEVVPRPVDVPDVAETADTFEGNARLKAEALVAATGMAALAEDSGLEVDALDGRPGVRSARFAGDGATDADNVALLLRELAGVPDRRARFRTVAILLDTDRREVVAEGSVEGHISVEPRGSGGFGYDPVFIPQEGDGRTFAEMTPDEKHQVSHRGRALRTLIWMLHD